MHKIILILALFSISCFPLDYDIGGHISDSESVQHVRLKHKDIAKPFGVFMPITLQARYERSGKYFDFTYEMNTREYYGFYKSKTSAIWERNNRLNINRASIRKSFEYDFLVGNLTITPDFELFYQENMLNVETGISATYPHRGIDFFAEYRLNNEESKSYYSVENKAYGLSYENKWINNQNYRVLKWYFKGSIKL